MNPLAIALTAKARSKTKVKPATKQDMKWMDHLSPTGSDFPGHPPGESGSPPPLEVHASTLRTNMSNLRELLILEGHTTTSRHLDSPATCSHN